MILIRDKVILFVPDFGVSAEDKAMVSLKEAIEAEGGYAVTVADLPTMIRDEHQGEELTDAKVIELSVRKLEQLSAESYLTVVFGKSAMLAGGVGRKDVLFVNPEYDSEWPWKKQYYADEKLAAQYRCDKFDYESDSMETVAWSGSETSGKHRYSRRYGIVTNTDYIGEFWDRYSRMAEVARELDGDTTALANFIREFADGKVSFPLEEVYEALSGLPTKMGILNHNEICNFTEPVRLNNFTALGIRMGVPMANGQSGYKLKVAAHNHTVPLEDVVTHRELNVLRDAIVRTNKENGTRMKRILIVPDYFTPYDSPIVKELHSLLKYKGYYVAVFMAGDTLEKSRQGLERRSKTKPFGLIVTLETGCLLAGRVTNCPRIFVNPDWTAWEWMKLRLGEDTDRYEHRGADNSGPVYSYYLNDDEIEMAQKMAERSYIKRGSYPVYGWFSEDAVESHLAEEHLKRFNTSCFIPDLRLDTEKGIEVLSNQIDNILNIDDE